MANKKGLPTTEQTLVLMQRYANMRITSINTKQKAIDIRTDTSEFKKPIFFNTDCGKALNKIKMTLKQQAFYPCEDKSETSKIVLDGNANLIDMTCNYHQRLLGDDPYNPNKPFNNNLYIMHGLDIPEFELMDKY